jgi:hypothetical protein
MQAQADHVDDADGLHGKDFGEAGDVWGVNMGPERQSPRVTPQRDPASKGRPQSRFDVLYETYYPMVYAFVFRRLVNSRDDVSDVTAEVFAESARESWRLLPLRGWSNAKEIPLSPRGA